MIFDKTGTLTEGKPALTDVITTNKFSETELLHFAASADQPSQHPLAQAIVTGARARGIEISSPENFDSIPGHGVEARVDQRRVLIGNKKLMLREKVSLDGLEERVSTLASDAKTAIYVAVDGQSAGVVAVADTIRESAQRALLEAHLAEGNWVEGRRGYESYRDLLWQELGVDPGPELTSLLDPSRFREPLLPVCGVSPALT